jgi:predicted tellurium resistance membrane protein TerC
MELLFDPEAWASLITLTSLEIVLGVDNIVVLAMLTSSLPRQQARKARSAGLVLALVLRLLLLSAISWMTHLTAPAMTVAGTSLSWRGLILIAGGLFLMVKATQDIHAEIEGEDEAPPAVRGKARFGAVIAQIAVMDLIFSLDSIVTAVGLAREIEVMAAAICIAIAIMYFAANVTGDFIERHPTLKMLALCFLILIGAQLVAEGFGAEISKVYIYLAMGFAGAVESLNIWVKTAANRRGQAKREENTNGPGAAQPAKAAAAEKRVPFTKSSWQSAAPAAPDKPVRKKARRK